MGNEQVASSGWSEVFPLDAPGGVAVVSIPMEGSEGAFVVAVSAARPGGGCQSRTKTLTFRAR